MCVRWQARGGGVVGVTSLAVSSWDPDAFLLGSEGGLLLRCSFSSQLRPDGPSLTRRAPPVFPFRRGSGPVHSIHASPFHWSELRPAADGARGCGTPPFTLSSAVDRKLFVSGGTEGVAHLHSLLQSQPLLSLRVGHAYVFQVQWSPSRPLVFAAATAEGRSCPTRPDPTHDPTSRPSPRLSFLSPPGEVQVFDLGRRSPRPVATLEGGGGGGGGAATCLAFNSQNPQLLAVGRANGSVDVWHLSSELTEQQPREEERLQQLANQVAG